MRFIRKSIIRKLFVNLFLFSLLIVIIAYFFYRQGEDLISFNFLLVGLGVFLIYFLISYWVDVIRPLRKVLGPVQSLLAGKSYQRIYTNRVDEIGILAYFFNQVTSSLGEVSSSIKDRERMIEELTVASRLQADILPREIPHVKGLEIVAKNRPATELGGDSFNVFKKNHDLFLYIGDVTGHGVAAGLIMTMVSTLISVFADMVSSPYEIMVKVNKYVKKYVKKSMFMTAVMLAWNSETSKMSYVGAGHEHILVYRSNTGECDAILSGGVALGMVPDNSKVISEKEVELGEGDFVILYSDGITEARNDKNELFGLERLQGLVKEYCSQYSAEGVHYHIAKAVSDYMGKHPQEDDMTLIVMKRDSKITGAEKTSQETKF